MKNKKGFTLVELIVVIAVLALLAVGAVLAFQGIQSNARRTNLTRAAGNLATAVNSANNRIAGAGDPTLNFVGIPAPGVPLARATAATTAPTDALTAVTIAYVGNELIIFVPRCTDTGMGSETFNVTFSNDQEADNAIAVVNVVASAITGGTPNASSCGECIAAWDTRTAITAACTH